MGFKAGIVGLPNVGKSTIFNSLSAAKAESANYPFCTIEPNVGIISVPDKRLDKLAELVHPERTLPAVVEIVDIAGLVKGASKGEGLGNQFLANIRETDAILHVLRCFDDENIVHVEGSTDPIRDKEIIEMELQIKDLESVEKRLQKAIRQAKSKDKDALEEKTLLEKMKVHLEEGKNVRSMQLNDKEEELAKTFFMLTEKPVLYICNVDEASISQENEHVQKVRAVAKAEGAQVVVISAAIEAEITEMEDENDRREFLDDLGIEEPGLHVLIRSAYNLLGLKTYFTAGVKEVRAWTILDGMTAPEAAGVIHTDFQKGFIRAEVIPYNDYIEFGSEEAVKAAGKLQVIGKEYVVNDGDVMHFRFNV